MYLRTMTGLSEGSSGVFVSKKNKTNGSRLGITSTSAMITIPKMMEGIL
jgi:hypothetical protein